MENIVVSLAVIVMFVLVLVAIGNDINRIVDERERERMENGEDEE